MSQTPSPPASARLRVAVSIVSHGQTVLVDQLLTDLSRLEPGAIDLLVLTLNLRDEPVPAAWARDWPTRGLLIRNESAKGFGANHNAAFDQALGMRHDLDHWVWAVLNPDLRVADAAIFRKLCAALVPGVDLVAPGVTEFGQVAPSARGLYTPWAAFKAFTGFGRDLKVPPDWLAGMFLMLRASTYKHLGGFDPRYFMYCEDVDLSLRVQLAGGRIRYVENVWVDHAAQRASHRSRRALVMHLRSALKLWASKAYWSFLLGRRR